MHRVDHRRGELAHLRVHDRVHLHVRHRVQTHVGELEVHVVVHAQLDGGPARLLVLLPPPVFVVGVLGRAAVGHTHDANLVAPWAIPDEQPTRAGIAIGDYDGDGDTI